MKFVAGSQVVDGEVAKEIEFMTRLALALFAVTTVREKQSGEELLAVWMALPQQDRLMWFERASMVKKAIEGPISSIPAGAVKVPGLSFFALPERESS